MKRLPLLYAIISLTVITIAGGLVGCGSGGEPRSDCDCGLCVNDQPEYPCDNEENCANFAANQGCISSQLANDPNETCGGAPQPVCQVRSCAGQCTCPGITSASVAE